MRIVDQHAYDHFKKILTLINAVQVIFRKFNLSFGIETEFRILHWRIPDAGCWRSFDWDGQGSWRRKCFQIQKTKQVQWMWLSNRISFQQKPKTKFFQKCSTRSNSILSRFQQKISKKATSTISQVNSEVIWFGLYIFYFRLTENEASTLIQSWWRGVKTRRRPEIRELIEYQKQLRQKRTSEK